MAEMSRSDLFLRIKQHLKDKESKELRTYVESEELLPAGEIEHLNPQEIFVKLEHKMKLPRGDLSLLVDLMTKIGRDDFAKEAETVAAQEKEEKRSAKRSRSPLASPASSPERKVRRKSEELSVLSADEKSGPRERLQTNSASAETLVTGGTRSSLATDTEQSSSSQQKRKKENGDQPPVKTTAQLREGSAMEGVRRYFFFIKKRVSSHWGDLAFFLGFQQAAINNITGRNPDDNSRCMDLLEEWLRLNGERATIEVLMKALSDAELQSTVDELKIKYPDCGQWYSYCNTITNKTFPSTLLYPPPELRCSDLVLPVPLQLGLGPQTSAQGGISRERQEQLMARILDLECTLFTADVLMDDVRRKKAEQVLLSHKAFLTGLLSGSVILLLTFLRQTDVDRFYHNHYRVGEGTLSQQLSHILISDDLQDKVKGAQLIVRLHVKHEDYVRVRDRLGQGLVRTTSVDNLLALPPPISHVDCSNLSSLDLAVVSREDQLCDRTDDIPALNFTARQVQTAMHTSKEKSQQQVRRLESEHREQMHEAREQTEAMVRSLTKEITRLKEKDEKAQKIILEQKDENKKLTEVNKSMADTIEELMNAKGGTQGEDPGKKEDPGREPGKKEDPGKEPGKEEDPVKDPGKKEDPGKEPGKEEDPGKDPGKKEDRGKEPGKEEDPGKDPGKKEDPVKEPGKKEDPGKDPGKKEDTGKEPGKKEDSGKKEDPRKDPVPGPSNLQKRKKEDEDFPARKKAYDKEVKVPNLPVYLSLGLKQQPSSDPRAVLLVIDKYVTSVNREVAQVLTGAGRKVYCTVLQDTEEDRKAAEVDGVELILPYCSQGDTREPCLDWLTFDHHRRYPRLPEDVGWIVGHAGVTSRAAAAIQEQRFPQANLGLVIGTIPEDTAKYMDDEEAMGIGRKEDSIREDAEKADVVFSVGHNIHDHFTNYFRAIPENKKPIHHLFLPKPSDLFQKTTVQYRETKEKVVLSIGGVNKVERLKGYGLTAKSLVRVAETSLERILWRICNISEEEFQATMSILQACINSGKLIPTLLPHCTQEDICRHMQQAHLVLMPSRAEPFGLVGLEAMAAGVPVLISDQSGLATLVEEVIPEFHHSVLEVEGDDSVDVGRWASQIKKVLRMSKAEFRKAADLRAKLLESRYWEESHQQLLQAFGGAAKRPAAEGPSRSREGHQEDKLAQLIEENRTLKALVQKLQGSDKPRSQDKLPGAEKPGSGRRPLVLLLNDEYGTRKGGISTVNRQIGCFLASKGAMVLCTVLTATQQDMDDAAADGIQLVFPTTFKRDPREAELSWLTIDHQVRYPDLPSHVDFIVGHIHLTSHAARRIKERFPDAKLIQVAHVMPEDTSQYKGDERVLSIGQESRNILDDLRHADVLFSVGPLMYEYYKHQTSQLTLQHHELLPKPSDIFIDMKLKPPADTETKVVLSIGRVKGVERLKGIDLAAKTMGKVIDKLPHTKWRLCGIRRDDFQASRSIIEAYTGNIVFTPLEYATQEELCEDMGKADVILMPSRAEPFGLVGLEAIAAGVPVVISNKSGLAKFLTKQDPEFDRTIVEIDDDDDEAAKTLSKRIIKILTDGPREFRAAQSLKKKLLDSEYWAKSYSKLLQTFGLEG
ncbi:PREDICTED: uncharacterized protein LOC109482191 [Branchiostoma belcheri]|uniref:Uncharacterized protein LOC109482191 n=1 Tax=Branchiostoma belcheri TaxID=7741 RepID=A0A6P5AF50_BRABE|nr:PREDICTED: uncharacterized protein LOC109482191 [Branchiostoma belcheri]